MANAFSNLDANQVLQAAFVDASGCLKVSDGFLMGQVGRKIEVGYPTATTETYTYMEGATTIFVLTVTYVDATKDNVSSVERTA